MLTVAVPALVDVDAFCAHFAIPIWTLAGEGAFCIETLLTGLAVVTVLFTLIHIHAAVSLGLKTWRAGVEWLAGCVLQAGVDLVGWFRGRDDRGRARKAQVPTIVVEALHLSLTGLWDRLTFIYIFAVLSLWIPVIPICTFRVGVSFCGWL